jgi:hypothetical protein
MSKSPQRILTRQTENTPYSISPDGMPESDGFGKPGGPIRPPLHTYADGDAAGHLDPPPHGEGTSGVSHREPGAAATAQPSAGQGTAAPTSPRGLPGGSRAPDQEDRISRFAELDRLIAAESAVKKRKRRRPSANQHASQPSDSGKLTRDLAGC